MRNFMDLRVWQEAHTLTVSLYRLTKSFPKDELYGLTSQIRRSCLSIEANLAEGCGRRSDNELARFVQIAMGSASASLPAIFSSLATFPWLLHLITRNRTSG